MFPFRQPAALAAASFPPCLLRSSARSPPSLSLSLTPFLLRSHTDRGPSSMQQPLLGFSVELLGPFLSLLTPGRLLTNYFISLMTIMNKADGCRVVAC